MSNKHYEEVFRKLWYERLAETERLALAEQQAAVQRIEHVARIRTDAMQEAGCPTGTIVRDSKGRVGSVVTVCDYGWAEVSLRRKDGTFGRSATFYEWEVLR